MWKGICFKGHAYSALHSCCKDVVYKHVAARSLLCTNVRLYVLLAPVVLRVVNVDRAGSGQWVNFSTADLGNRDGDSISFLVLPENIGNLSSCPTAIVSGAVAGLHQVLPQYSSFSAPAASGDGSEGRILSGLWLVALSLIENTWLINSHHIWAQYNSYPRIPSPR